MVVERRKEPRQKSLLEGKLVFNRRQSVMDCLVRNISGHGALMVFPHSSLTPSEFTLHIPHRNETYSAKVVWRHQDRAGVVLSNTETFEAPIDATMRIRRLAVENSRLLKQLDPGRW